MASKLRYAASILLSLKNDIAHCYFSDNSRIEFRSENFEGNK